SSPAARQSLSKLVDTLASASIFNSLAGIAVDVISLFMALLSSRGISTPSLQARGEQRRFFYFNIIRVIPTQLFKGILQGQETTCREPFATMIVAAVSKLPDQIFHNPSKISHLSP